MTLARAYGRRSRTLNPYRSRRYTRELAHRIYRAYECDFDRFGYPRALPA